MRNIFLLICLQKYRPVEYLLLFKQHSSCSPNVECVTIQYVGKSSLDSFFLPSHIYPINVWVFFSSELEVDIEEGHKVLFVLLN